MNIIRLPLQDDTAQPVAADAELETAQCAGAFKRVPLDEELEVPQPNKED